MSSWSMMKTYHWPSMLSAGVVVGYRGVEPFLLVLPDGRSDEVLGVRGGLPLGRYGRRRCLCQVHGGQLSQLLGDGRYRGVIQVGDVARGALRAGRPHGPRRAFGSGHPGGSWRPFRAGRPNSALRPGRPGLSLEAGVSLLAGDKGQGKGSGQERRHEHAHRLTPRLVLADGALRRRPVARSILCHCIVREGMVWKGAAIGLYRRGTSQGARWRSWMLRELSDDSPVASRG